ncbi:NADH-dependent fumarate reductase [Trypanosoma grayi]|uniref:NADH-dependent fumarate reductase n=1 Tax=Trypanosoma grayi TaxID=71804 RepID=UPI0004F401D6|nr:NADH-dependent fumarate reductase [Trypanosoma grayi]KEG07090.1 NADH-dependent fumarate reductase [Trypanosoma grayi]
MISARRILCSSSNNSAAVAGVRRGVAAMTATAALRTASTSNPVAAGASATKIAMRCGSSMSSSLLPLVNQQRFTSGGGGVDGLSSASKVVVDPASAAKERDRLAREMLSSNVPHQSLEERAVVTLKGLEHTVPYTLRIVVESTDAAKESETKAGPILRDAFEMVDQHLNHFNPNSEVSKVNRLPVGEKHKMSEHMLRVMECCMRVYQSSGTCFDPATSPLVKRLRQMMEDKENTDPVSITEEEMERFSLPHSFDIDLSEATIARCHADAQLDLGGVNKGYTVDYVVEKLVAAGIENLMFEWGGDCRAVGLNYQRQLWAVAIARPPSVEEVERRARMSAGGAVEESFDESRDSVPLLRVVHLDDEALCTSGDYENVMYHPKHGVCCTIFDWKKKGLLDPGDDELAQVSVKCYSAMYADALATASLLKRDTVKVRYMLDGWRYSRNRVMDYSAYTRSGERLAHMYEIAKESPELRRERIAGSLPARVIVVGGGLAGQSAAIEAASCGAQVILMEKAEKLGGNSAKATSGINGWGTRAQAMRDIHDNCKTFERDTHLSGLGGTCDHGLVRTLSVKSGDAIRWLISLGVPLTVLSQLGGHSQKRTHRAPDKADGSPVPIGFTIMRTLEQHIRTHLSDRVTIMEKTSVTRLLHRTKNRPDGVHQVKVTGVEIQLAEGEKTYILADSVILATGGFSNDKTANSLLREYAPQLSGFPTTNGSWATGDGVKLARELGVKLVDMDKVQLHPTGLVDPKDPGNPTKYLGPEALRGSGGILLNKQGERFVNELDLRSVVSKAIIDQGNEYPGLNGSMFAYCVLNEAAQKLFGVNSHSFYWKRLGLFVKVDTVEDLAKLIKCPAGNVQKTLEEHEQLSRASRACPKTQKNVYPCVLGPQGPFYVAFVTPSIHYTMGGCLISPSAEMQMEDSTSSFGHRRPILALFGAGEVTGGVHGGNRLGGNSLLECVVFGRIAGGRSARILRDNVTFLWHNKWSQVTVQSALEDDNGFVWLRFSLPSSLQLSGLEALQAVVLRAVDGDGQLEVRMPFTLPDEEGVVGVALSPQQANNSASWLRSLQPGDAVEMKAADLPKKKHALLLKSSRQIVIATPHGVAAMMQIIRAGLEKPDDNRTFHLIFLADRVSTIPQRKELEVLEKKWPQRLRCTFVLQSPPPKWTGSVDYADTIAASAFPDAKQGIFLCGAAEETRPIKALLLEMGHYSETIATVE